MLRSSLARFYAFAALRWFQLTASLWVLYLVHLGWSLWQVGVGEVAFHVAGMAANLPAGALADRYGRRPALLAGVAIAATQSLLMIWLVPHGFLFGVLVMAYHGLAWAFIGGADQALLYDLVPDRGQFSKVYGRLLAIIYTGMAAGGVAGGWLAQQYGWMVPFIAAAVVQALAFVAVLTIAEPRLHHPEAGSNAPVPSLTSRLAEGLGALRTVPGLLGLTLFYGLVGVFVTINHLYGQVTISSKGADIFTMTLILGAGTAIGGLGSLLAGARASRPGFPALRLFRAATALLAVLLAGVGTLPLFGAGGSYVLSGAVDGVIDPVAAAALSTRSPDSVRATVLSAPDTVHSLGMVVLFPLVGLALSAGGIGIPATYGVMGALVLVVGIGALRNVAASSPGPAAP